MQPFPTAAVGNGGGRWAVGVLVGVVIWVAVRWRKRVKGGGWGIVPHLGDMVDHGVGKG